MERLRQSFTGASNGSTGNGGSGRRGGQGQGQQRVELMASVCNSINNISSSHICAICTDQFTDPRALPCLHTFCLRCLDDYSRRHQAKQLRHQRAGVRPTVSFADTVDDNGPMSPSKPPSTPDDSTVQPAPSLLPPQPTLSCPLCRREFQLPPEGASGLPRNVYAEDLVAICGISRRICGPCDACLLSGTNFTSTGSTSAAEDLDDEAAGTANADGCNDESKVVDGGSRKIRPAAVASMCCVDCRMNLCERCCKQHRKLKPTRAHRIIAISSKDPPLPPHLAVTSVVGALPEGQPVGGIAILGKDVYVVRALSNQLDVFDADTYTFKRQLLVPELHTPQDMAACSVHCCLYITDRAVHCVHRIVPSSKRRHSEESMRRQSNPVGMTKWPVDDWPGGLSVTSDTSVLVTCKETRKVKVYTSQGTLLRTIVLPAEIQHPWQTVRLPTGQLIVSHGIGSDTLNRVCLLDHDGRVVQASYGGPRGHGSGQLNVPVRIAVDSRGFTTVADFNNSRLVLLAPATLAVVREFSNAIPTAATRNDAGLRCPMRICIDESRNRMFVGDQSCDNGKWADGRVLVLATTVSEGL